MTGMRDNAIGRVERAVREVEGIGGRSAMIELGDLRELLSLARGNRDAFADALTIAEELAGDVPVTRDTWRKLRAAREALDRLSPEKELK